ncbi:MAG: hypothetical protein ACR2OI_00030, partial [Acidimicrobiia bacterium]
GATTTTAGATTTTAASATTTTTAAATTTTEATTTTTKATPAPAALPATPVAAVMGTNPANETYFTTGEFDAAVMGVEPGAATARWFKAEGFYVVFFDGVSTADTGPLCPGASLATDTFQFVSNAPSAGADCSTFSTLSDDPTVRALECDGSIAYRTAIPDDGAGILFGTLEKPVDGGIMGITSLSDSSLGEIPEVDISELEC